MPRLPATTEYYPLEKHYLFAQLRGGNNMLWIEQGLYVRIQELENGPRPLPLQSGFSRETAYRVLGCFNPSETSDAYYILANDRDEIWFICNRHIRVVRLDNDRKDFRYEISSFV